MASKAKRRARQDQDKCGYDGAKVTQRPLRTGNRQVLTQNVRALPGTFEWRYGAKGGKEEIAFYHAGTEFARVWERAGIASAGMSGLSDSGGGDWKGLPDARCVALDDVREVMRAVGKVTSARMVSYCVDGKTAGQIARAWNTAPRDMAAILRADLHALALHYRLIKSH